MNTEELQEVVTRLSEAFQKIGSTVEELLDGLRKAFETVQNNRKKPSQPSRNWRNREYNTVKKIRLHSVFSQEFTISKATFLSPLLDFESGFCPGRSGFWSILGRFREQFSDFYGRF